MYHRILWMLSIADLFASCSFLIFPFVKLATDGYPWAIGNDATCAAGGAMLMFFTEVAQTFNLYLAFYFFMAVRRGWDDERFQTRLERPFLALFIGAAAAVVTTALSLDLINPHKINGTCYLGSPCEDDDNSDACLRAEDRLTIVGGAIVLKSQIITIFSFCLTLAVYLKIRQQYSRMKRRTLNPDSLSERQRQASYQLIWFSLVYFNSVLWATIFIVWTVVDPDYVETAQGDPPLYYILLVSNIFVPLQGFLNCIIYMRPMVATRRNRYRESWWSAVVTILRRQHDTMAAPPEASSKQTEYPSSKVTSLPISRVVDDADNGNDDDDDEDQPFDRTTRLTKTKTLRFNQSHMGLDVDFMDVQEDESRTVPHVVN